MAPPSGIDCVVSRFLLSRRAVRVNKYCLCDPMQTGVHMADGNPVADKKHTGPSHSDGRFTVRQYVEIYHTGVSAPWDARCGVYD
jgi:hypothetical protein